MREGDGTLESGDIELSSALMLAVNVEAEFST
jgi:hypothetical protein